MSPGNSIRVAVEGCGHGTLDAIYDSIRQSCKVKGWDGVDLAIIGGDFQAVRNQQDLNVTAMPAKYRQMADFYQYYYGAKTAPFLTVFIGGNHEASNHLWELYYGGWVAPNIYYLGAANVIRFGPLKIAALSGIWKGVDYRKPHFERLPYNEGTMRSIYHVRELDTRKLLSYRTQVDIGLSHDWPNGIEWLGNYKQLFRHKSFLQDDARSGRLGNIAARQILDRLRPLFWFSAHLHTRYIAFKDFTTTEEEEIRQKELGPNDPRLREGRRQAVNAWKSFHKDAKQDESIQDEEMVQSRKDLLEDAERTGIPVSANYNIVETFKQTNAANAGRVTVESFTLSRSDSEVPQLDGTCCSVSRKRPRKSSTPDALVAIEEATGSAQAGDSNPALRGGAVDNPDAIDVDSSNDETDAVVTKFQGAKPPSAANPDAIAVDISDSEEEGGAQMHPIPKKDDEPSSAGVDLNHEEANGKGIAEPQTTDVSDDVRVQLAAMSGTFVKEQPFEPSPPLPHPSETITNTQTRFLALSKCEFGQNFLQLLEIEPYDKSENAINRPLHLQYDPEWLAIQRAFASELELGGAPNQKVPPHLGDTFYRDQIMKEEKWIQENVVDKSLLEVPQNFVQMVTRENDAVGGMPGEQTNPQTSQFCELIGIENKFDFDEADREQRSNRGAEPESSTYHGRGRGRGRGFGRGSRDGRGYSRGRGRRW